jgi:hypothetical protein
LNFCMLTKSVYDSFQINECLIRYLFKPFITLANQALPKPSKRQPKPI